ncbi:hypothetical protein K439DRAFT_1406329 [Ramaria rubella]|nr:hypothetical protein K439DRAFT_1406329 [Ramaria rubella]
MAGTSTGTSNTSPSASTPHLPTSPPSSSKLPKFLHRQPRDRAKSTADLQPPPSPSNTAGPSSVSQSANHSSKHTIVRKTSRLLGLKEREERPDTPTIVEPLSPSSPPRSRFTSEHRPMSSVSDGGPYNSIYPSASSGRLSDLPSRLSGWLSHTLTGSAADLSLPSLLSQSQIQSAAAGASPKSKGAGLLTAARHGKGHLDKAVRYLLDSDAQPDKCTDPIWLLGVLHPGYEPSPPPHPPSPSTPPPTRRDSIDSRRSPSSRRSSGSSSHSYSTLNTSQSASSSKHAPSWPVAFYSDFTSRVWLTYRSHYAPIRDVALASLDVDSSEASQLSSSQSKRWNWPVGGEKGWTSDTGWGCMLRTGQSLLANALIHLHLSRDWRRPLQAASSQDYASYVKILTWFLDNPSPLCPFGVHRMALAGKELGKDVGQWFGPSTAAGAIRRLVHEFPEAQLAVSLASDGVVFDSDVYAASNFGTDTRRRHTPRFRWGGRAVLVLVGIRLGIDGVNPIYYEGVKALFMFPQSVGIAGGRPSSSYYFVGSQADSLFYLDPHHTRPAIPLRTPPEDDDGRMPYPQRRVTDSPEQQQSLPLSCSQQAQRSNTGPTRAWSPTSPSRHTLAPSPLSHEYLSGTASPPTDLDPVLDHYVNAYPPAELRTFHCERVRKMPISGLDPSMLLGFLCKDEADYQDFRVRVADLSKKHKPIFSIQEEPPTWGDDSDDVGLESVSEPDLERDHEDGEEDGAFFSNSPSPAPPSTEDSFDPVTPNPLSDRQPDPVHDADEFEPEVDIGLEEEDDGWIAPSPPPPPSRITSNGLIVARGDSKGKEKARKVTSPSPSPPQHFPFPSSDDNEDPEIVSGVRHVRDRGESRPAPHLRSIRARNGGRTQSGGVKGVWKDDGETDEF